MTPGCLWRIVSPHFVAEGVVVEAAPILGWARGRRWPAVRVYCQRRGWHGEPLG